ncbi:MAG TPA: tetratricopeptide repeat protein [Pyrinomonadaceae bacterium]|nr:tetratricopeptide repeat protein [Pyrinomonadaceae bacterium]
MSTRSQPSYFAFSLIALAVLTCFSTYAQSQPATVGAEDRDRGIRLYQKGDTKGAIEALRAATSKNRDDGDAWHYLGLALLATGNKDEARKAFEKAAMIRLNDLITISPLPLLKDPAPGSEGVKRRERYQAALESSEQYLALTPRPTDDWRFQLEALSFYRDYYAGARSDETIVTTKETNTRLRILSKPPPDFSRTTASGNSVLRAVFSADGSVKHVLVLKRVAPDFDLACIEAARKIKFMPAIKDGHPVSMILQLEYNRYFL